MISVISLLIPSVVIKVHVLVKRVKINVVLEVLSSYSVSGSNLLNIIHVKPELRIGESTYEVTFSADLFAVDCVARREEVPDFFNSLLLKVSLELS